MRSTLRNKKPGLVTIDPLARQMADCGVTYNKCRRALPILLRIIKEEVARGNEVYLYEFGTFKPYVMPAKWFHMRGKDHRTPYYREPKKTVRFKKSPQLVAYVRGYSYQKPTRLFHKPKSQEFTNA